MNYEKKYKEALERASKLIVQNPFDTVGQMVEHIFPELQDSESERTRKELIEFLKLPHSQFVGNREHEKWIAWLEKQGEQNFDYEHADIPQKDFAPIEQKTLNAEKQGHMLDTNKVIEWLCSNSTLFGAKWCKTENIIEQFKKDFGL